ncbi:hypothetical protein [Microbispora bryophytorum]|uniref:hypothetical protein n=1 Tax=Microbispora bryophytorum TaxID=1460882 RepID=UPI0034039D11
MTAAAPTPEPRPEDIERGLAELERHLAAQAPATEQPREADGVTKRVRRLRAEVAEAHLLAKLQDDDAPLLLDTPKVRKRRKAAYEAARLHELAQDPIMRAWQADRMRRLLLVAAMVSLTLALGWSTAGVQGFAAEGAPQWSPAWIFAWFVEPFMSLALLVVVGARAYMGTRGQPITSKTLTRIEWLFLALTLGMNAWPHLPGVVDEFTVSGLVLHILGPVVAVAVVTALPIILAAFAGLDHGPRTGPSYRANTGPDIDALAARARLLIASGELPPTPGADKIRRALGCGMDTARAVRDALHES